MTDSQEKDSRVLLSAKDLFMDYAEKTDAAGGNVKREKSDAVTEGVLHGIRLEIRKGDFAVVMGPSGAGKSTLLHCLSGMERPTSGKVCYLGKDLYALSENESARLRAGAFGLVFQQAQLIGDMTVFDNVLLAALIAGKESDQEARSRTEKLLDRMGVAGLSARLPSQVSGGEAQRVQVARAMAGQPEILFADEPTGALNKRNTEALLDILSALNRNGQTVLMVTHDIRCAVRGTRVLYMEDGSLSAEHAFPAWDKDDERGRAASLESFLHETRW